MAEEVIIDGQRYRRVSESGVPPLRILVLQRGWVVVGRVAGEGTDEIEIRDASVIRRWGTTRGLGQLAAEGPQRETVLDPAGTVRAHPLGIVLSLDCEVSKWTGR